VATTAFGVGTVLSQTIPKAKSWMLVTIDRFSHENLPVRILAGAIEFRLFPIGITLTDVRILPSRDFTDTLPPLTIQEVSADLSLLQIVRGEVALDEVAIRGADLSVTLPKPPPSTGKPLEGLFKALDSIPVSTLILSEISAIIRIPHQNAVIEVEHAHLEAERSRAELQASLSADSIVAKDLKDRRALRFTPEIAFTLTPKTIELTKVDIRRGDSLIALTGSLTGDTEALAFTNGGLQTTLDLDVKSTRDWLQKSFEDAEPTPPMSGRLQFTADIEKTGEKNPWLAEFKLATSEYRVEGILLDQVTAQGQWDGKAITIPQILSKSRAGILKMETVKIGRAHV
jgi:hypothetical protein